jgi:LmbE family N-acetylglucosaminyl deacetylase
MCKQTKFNSKLSKSRLNLVPDQFWKVLGVFAHPDDVELTCSGTLARLCDENNCKVSVLILTDGSGTASVVNTPRQTRQTEALAASRVIGYELKAENVESDGRLAFNIDLVRIIDRHINRLSPEIVITHYPQDFGIGHQDHLAVSKAVVNSANRNPSVRWILYAEPPVLNSDFSPNYFVNITRQIEKKKEAIQKHKSQSKKMYMQSSIIEARGRWWSIQANPPLDNQGGLNSQHEFYEAFIVVKGVF